MAKPLQEFGGWLRFFQVIAAINYILALFASGLAVGVLVAGAKLKGYTSVQLMVDAVALIPFAFVMLKMLAHLPIADSNQPKVLAQCAYAAVAINLLADIAVAADPTVTFTESLAWHGFGGPLVFLCYLQYSKRVKVFYGANYLERSKDPYIKDPIEDMIEGWRNRPGRDR